MMHEGYVLNDGREVKTPYLDGVLERALNLAQEWIKQKPELESIPSDILLFQAIACADVLRVLEGFKKADIDEKTALHYGHTHLPEWLMYMGVLAVLGGFTTWHLDFTHWDSGDPSRPPTYLLEPYSEQISEKDLRNYSYFARDFPEIIGSEATEHLIKAIYAYDKYARNTYKTLSEIHNGLKNGK